MEVGPLQIAGKAGAVIQAGLGSRWGSGRGADRERRHVRKLHRPLLQALAGLQRRLALPAPGGAEGVGGAVPLLQPGVPARLELSAIRGGQVLPFRSRGKQPVLIDQLDQRHGRVFHRRKVGIRIGGGQQSPRVLLLQLDQPGIEDGVGLRGAPKLGGVHHAVPFLKRPVVEKIQIDSDPMLLQSVNPIKEAILVLGVELR